MDDKSEAPSRVYVVFTAEINNTTLDHLIQALTNLSQQGVGEVYLAYSTSGGGIREGIALYNFLRGIPFNLITHNIGEVSSMGNPGFLAANTRYACPKSSFMFHSFHWLMEAKRYRQGELKEIVNELSAGQNLAKSILIERTAITENQAKGFFGDRKTLLPERARDLGIIDDIREFSIPKGAPIITFTFS